LVEEARGEQPGSDRTADVSDTRGPRYIPDLHLVAGPRAEQVSRAADVGEGVRVGGAGGDEGDRGAWLPAGGQQPVVRGGNEFRCWAEGWGDQGSAGDLGRKVDLDVVAGGQKGGHHNGSVAYPIQDRCHAGFADINESDFGPHKGSKLVHN
jgi:hypothetical protein